MKRVHPEYSRRRVRPMMRRATTGASIVVLLALAGCADMSDLGPRAALRDAPSLGLVAGDATVSDVDSRWWQALGDPQLNELIERALKGNPNLQIAGGRLARAQALTAVAAAAGRPQINGSLDLTRQKFSNNFIYPPPLGGSIQESGTLQLNGSWELDFFGKNRAALDAAIGSANAAAADAQAARVLLASNVARGYVQWARLSGQLAVAQRTLAQREETFKLVRDRLSAGLDTHLELRQSEGSLPEARQQIEAVREQITLTRHALDALVSEPNVTKTFTPPELMAIKTIAIQSVIPADLLGRRADVAAARWRVEAAASDVKNAKAQFYPNINLVAFAGFQSIGFDTLLRSGSQQGGVGPAVRLPIFEGEKLRANLRGKAADLDVAIESYNAAVIDAVRDAADQVTSARSVLRQQIEQRNAQTASEAAYEIALQRYGAGLGNYLNVLAAETAVLTQRRQAVDLAARALDTQIGLARALGGGYQSPVSTAATLH